MRDLRTWASRMTWERRAGGGYWIGAFGERRPGTLVLPGAGHVATGFGARGGGTKAVD